LAGGVVRWLRTLLAVPGDDDHIPELFVAAAPAAVV
jgi:hypothetical protein